MADLPPQPSASAAPTKQAPIDLEEFRRQWRAEVEAKRKQAMPHLVGDGDADALPKAPASPPLNAAIVQPEDPNLVEPDAVSDLVLRKAKNADGSEGSGDAAISQLPASLALYIQAVRYERSGNLTDALVSYRQAFKMDPNADEAYGQHLRRMEIVKQNSNHLDDRHHDDRHHDDRHHDDKHHLTSTDPEFERFFHISDESHSKHGQDGMMVASQASHFADLVTAMQETSLNEPVEGTDSQTMSNLKALLPETIRRVPDELWLAMLSVLTRHQDVRTLARFAQSCRWAFLLTAQQDLWRQICARVFATMTSDPWLSAFGGDWRSVYIERPRVRFDGVYISTIHYLRPGSAEDVFNRPIHLVTYYRYLRFYADKECISICSTVEPALVVRGFNKAFRSRGFMHGTYELRCDPPPPLADGANAGRKRIEALATVRVQDEARSWNTYRMLLRVGGTRRGAWNRLMWSRYWSQDARRENAEDQFECGAWKPYYFSRVRSYGLE